MFHIERSFRKMHYLCGVISKEVADILRKRIFALFRQRELGHFTKVSRDIEKGRSSWFVFVYLHEIHPSGAFHSPYLLTGSPSPTLMIR